MTLLHYFRGLVIVSPADAISGERQRMMAKWWMDLLRNIVIVSAVQYVAQRSESILLKTVWVVSYGVLLAYCTSYINSWTLNPFPFMTNKPLAKNLTRIIYIPLLLVALFSVITAFDIAISEIARLHARDTPAPSLSILPTIDE